MKLKPSLKNLAKHGLLINLSLLLFCFIFSCTSSTTPTYTKEKIATAIQDICQDEYKIEVKARLIGQTLWIYLPLKEDVFVKDDKPTKYLQKFEIENINSELNGDLLKSEYSIKPIPDEEKTQEYKYNKEALEKITNVWKVLRRVIFSLESSKENEPHFFSVVTADIKNGFELKELSYYLDLKKVSYGFISVGEYQHRTPQDSSIAAEIIDDKQGLHLDYKDITLPEFITAQIAHRIKLKFQKPEVEKNADIDKEILKVIAYTVKTYDFRDFSEVELNNLLTQNKITLNNAAIWARPTE